MTAYLAIRKISDTINKICTAGCVLLLGTMVIVTFMQIICRVFFTAISWSEELARYLLVYSTFIGAGCVYRAKGHISVLAFQELFPPKIQKVMALVVNILCLVVFGIAVYYGIRYMGMQGTQKSPALHIPMRFVYVAIPTGFGIMFLHGITGILELLFEKGVEKK